MSDHLRRYTDILSLLDMLRLQRITLLDPSRWFDQNDAYGVQLYGKVKGQGRVVALCLAEGVEQAHHWQLFAGHNHGVCIHFDKSELIQHLDRFSDELLHGPVIYESRARLDARETLDLNTLPFLKSEEFAAEKEYRLVAWERWEMIAGPFTLPLPANLIKSVEFGPSMPANLAGTASLMIDEMPWCREIEFYRSALGSSDGWRNSISRIATGFGCSISR